MDELFLKIFLDNCLEGVIIIKNGFVVDINNRMLEILKYESKNDIIGKLATGMLIPNINKNFIKYNGKEYEEILLLSKNGDNIPAILSIKDIPVDKHIYKIAFILNLSELKNREHLLLEQSRMAAMGEMLSMIAHQWRQPLTSISAALSNLKLRIKMNKYSPKLIESKISDIDKYLSYMSNTIDDFRNFFKSEKEKELLNIGYVLNMALEIVEKPFEKNGIKIINKVNKLGNIYLLKNELLQVILNVLNNSKDAFEEKNSKNNIIKISYKEVNNFQKLIISDNAGGIKREILDKIFDPYFSTKSEKNGTGLGLYMSKIIIEKYFQGEIKAINIEDGVSFEIIIKK